jgi:hypothetical protein
VHRDDSSAAASWTRHPMDNDRYLDEYDGVRWSDGGQRMREAISQRRTPARERTPSRCGKHAREKEARDNLEQREEGGILDKRYRKRGRWNSLRKRKRKEVVNDKRRRKKVDRAREKEGLTS